jgi:hypothetical protein
VHLAQILPLGHIKAGALNQSVGVGLRRHGLPVVAAIAMQPLNHHAASSVAVRVAGRLAGGPLLALCPAIACMGGMTEDDEHGDGGNRQNDPEQSFHNDLLL